MTVIGDTVGVISIGLSCQTALQVRRHSRLLSLIFQEELKPQSMLFNWVWGDVKGVTALLQAGPVDTPPPIEVLSGVTLALADFRLLLAHDSGDLSKDGQAAAARKYQYLASKFWALRALERRVFVISNTQNDLGAPAKHYGLDHVFRRSELEALHSALKAAFPDGQTDLLVVSRPDMVLGLPPGVHCQLVGRDSTVWEGSDTQWTVALRQLRLLSPETTWQQSDILDADLPESPSAFFQAVGRILTTSSASTRDELLKHVDYLAKKSRTTRGKILEGAPLKVAPVILAESMQNISTYLHQLDLVP